MWLWMLIAHSSAKNIHVSWLYFSVREKWFISHQWWSQWFSLLKFGHKVNNKESFGIIYWSEGRVLQNAETVATQIFAGHLYWTTILIMFTPSLALGDHNRDLGSVIFQPYFEYFKRSIAIRILNRLPLLFISHVFVWSEWVKSFLECTLQEKCKNLFSHSFS